MGRERAKPKSESVIPQQENWDIGMISWKATKYHNAVTWFFRTVIDGLTGKPVLKIYDVNNSSIVHFQGLDIERARLFRDYLQQFIANVESGCFK